MTKAEKALRAMWRPVRDAMRAWEREEKRREKQLRKLWTPLARALQKGK